MDPIRSALELARTLSRLGHPAVLVGGAVRDLLLGRTPHDGDLATAAPPEALEALFPSLRRLDRPGGTTFLLPGPEGLLHETVSTFPGTLQDDLARRDLTVNALALDPRGLLLDPFGGREDLLAGRLRFTGEGADRLREDPLRALRLARFAAQLPGFAPTSDAVRCCREFPFPLGTLPPGRRGGELWRALGTDPARFLRWVRLLGLRDPFPELPPLPASAPPFLRRTCARTSDPVARAAALLETLPPRDPPAPAETLLSLGWPRGALRDLLALLSLPRDGEIPDTPAARRPLRQASPENLRRWLLLDSLRDAAPSPNRRALREAALRRLALPSRPSLSPKLAAHLEALPPDLRKEAGEAAQDRAFLEPGMGFEEALVHQLRTLSPPRVDAMG